MSIFLVIASTLTYYYILFNAGKSFEVQHNPTTRSKWMSRILWLAHSLLFFLAQYYYIPTYVSFLILLVLMFLTFYARFNESTLSLYFASIHYVFYIYTIRSIVLSIAAIITSTTIITLTTNPLINLLLFQLSLFLSIFYFKFLEKHFLTVDKVQILMLYPRQLIFVLLHKTILGLFMMLITYSVHYTTNQNWFNHFHLIASVLFTFLGTYTLKNGILITQTLDYQQHTQLLEKQLEMQTQQYKTYTQYTDNFRKFKHDFNSMIANVNALLSANHIEDAQKLLGEIAHNMESNVSPHQKYSNNSLLDVVLQDFANQCDTHGIQFKARVFWQNDISIDNLSLLRIFNNILKNALEANLFLDEDRFIHITSTKTDHWISVQFENAFDGYLPKNLKTRKKRHKHHGLGTEVIKQEVEAIGGIVSFDIKDKVFIVTVHFPLEN